MRRVHQWLSLLTACVVVVGLSGVVRAEKKADHADMHKQLYDTLREVHNKGADLYNSGDIAGCYRLFQGALLALKPLLSDHTDVQMAIDKALADAEKNPRMDKRAFALHEAIEDIRGKIKPGGAGAAKAPEKTTEPKGSLWERLGGESNVKKVVDDFVATAATDPKVNFDRNGKYKLDDAAVANLKKQLVDFVSAATGGPLKYTGKSMKESHAGMGITDAEFNAAAGHLKDALMKNGAKPEDIDLVMMAVGGTRKDIVETKKPEDKKPEDKKPEVKPKPVATLWDRLGGEANVKKVVDDFVAAAATDPKVNFDRNGKYKLDDAAVANLKKQIVDLVSAVSGGPLKYTGKSMKESHAGMGITDAEFNAAAGHLVDALKKNGAKKADIDELVGIVGATRKDIVEEKKPEDKKPEAKKPAAKPEDKKPEEKDK